MLQVNFSCTLSLALIAKGGDSKLKLSCTHNDHTFAWAAALLAASKRKYKKKFTLASSSGGATRQLDYDAKRWGGDGCVKVNVIT